MSPTRYWNVDNHKLPTPPMCYPSVLQGGMYIFQLFDYFASSGISLLFFGIFECICIGWVYGADRFYDNIQDMIGYRPWPVMKICWVAVTPAVCLATFLFALIRYVPLRYNNTYVYPPWGYAIGWLIAISSMICIPLYCIYIVLRTKGSLFERLRLVVIPAKDLPQPKASVPVPDTLCMRETPIPSETLTQIPHP
ncbi:hypothetical protein GDO81_019099 [Engystomops pustulosus]|uniref:Uncharacterized protein n=1 Tax=Engystomops pustulosus TaxID=76066 RepID=A0AAV6YZX1_ENGPU|nr:hypothetical protein GDO81_019099 [Engystomops pustulosus]